MRFGNRELYRMMSTVLETFVYNVLVLEKVCEVIWRIVC